MPIPPFPSPEALGASVGEKEMPFPTHLPEVHLEAYSASCTAHIEGTIAGVYLHQPRMTVY